MTAPLVVGVDIGGTKTAILVADADEGASTVLVRRVAPTAVGSPERAADAIASLVQAALDEAGARTGDVAALGICVPGRVEPETGHVTLAVNLDSVPRARRYPRPSDDDRRRRFSE